MTSLDDIGQPYTCFGWGYEGTTGIPIIIDDGSNQSIIHNWFDYDGAYPDNVFIDHEMNIVNITGGDMNLTAVNNIIQGMVDNIPTTTCEDPITSNFNDDGECDYTDVFTSYVSDIQPIFNANCTQCHGNSGGLSLANYDDLMSGSVVNLNDGVNSTIYQRMTSSTNPMPPTGLIDSYLAERIKAWIDQGAQECTQRSEERRVGKECRSRWSPYH